MNKSANKFQMQQANLISPTKNGNQNLKQEGSQQFRASNTFRHNKGSKQNTGETRNVFGTVGNKMAAFNSTKSIMQNNGNQ